MNIVLNQNYMHLIYQDLKKKKAKRDLTVKKSPIWKKKTEKKKVGFGLDSSEDEEDRGE